MAVKLGFADQVGTLEDARRIAGELAGLGEDPMMFSPPKERPSLSEILSEVRAPNLIQELKNSLYSSSLLGIPLYLMPGTSVR